MSTVTSAIFSTLLFITVFGAILFVAYATTKYIGQKAGKTFRGRYISVIETVSLGIDRQLHIIKVGEQHFLVASGGKHVEFLTQLDLNGYIEEFESTDIEMLSFKSVFDKYFDKFGKKENKFAKNPDEDFNNNLKKIREVTKKANNE